MNKKELKYLNSLLEKIEIFELFFNEFNGDMHDEFQARKFEDYIINFGIYKNTPIIKMNSVKQINYLNWYLSLDDNNSVTKLNQYIFKWWLTNKNFFKDNQSIIDLGDINWN